MKSSIDVISPQLRLSFSMANCNVLLPALALRFLSEQAVREARTLHSGIRDLQSAILYCSYKVNFNDQAHLSFRARWETKR